MQFSHNKLASIRGSKMYVNADKICKGQELIGYRCFELGASLPNSEK
jgi:hypothetical protein